MNDLKPVASFFESPGCEEDGRPSVSKIDFGVRGGKWKPLYYIPSTHRVVSVELLERVAGMLGKTMYNAGPPAAKEIRAIIDNKEQP